MRDHARERLLAVGVMHEEILSKTDEDCGEDAFRRRVDELYALRLAYLIELLGVGKHHISCHDNLCRYTQPVTDRRRGSARRVLLKSATNYLSTSTRHMIGAGRVHLVVHLVGLDRIPRKVSRVELDLAIRVEVAERGCRNLSSVFSHIALAEIELRRKIRHGDWLRVPDRERFHAC